MKLTRSRLLTARSPKSAHPAAWLAADAQYVWHPYTQMLGAATPLAITHAKGVYLYTADGRRILDGTSSWWVNIHGHNHPRLNRAIRTQLRQFAQVIFAGCTHAPGAQLAAQLVKRAPPGLTHLFYSDDGSTAVEVALKMAYQYWRHRGEPHRTRFVALENAYHGDTFAAMAAGGSTLFHGEFQPLLFAVERARGHGSACLQEMHDLFQREADHIAAVIIEPMVQGAGGMIFWPPEFLRGLRQLTAAHGILLIADEVFTGFGRTGRMFACEHGPISPDILCLSKALTGGYLPLAATLASEAVYGAFLSPDKRRTFFHGHSYTGNALACAVALESLAVFDEEQCLQRVGVLEELFLRHLRDLAELSVVQSTRALGALAVVEVRPEQATGGYLDPTGQKIARACLERGLMLRPLGNTLYFLPPYCITQRQVNAAFATLKQVLQQLTDGGAL